MITAFLIILGLILVPIVVLFVRGFIEGFRSYQKPQPTPEELRKLWYDNVSGQTPKPKQRFRVLWPQDEGDISR